MVSHLPGRPWSESHWPTSSATPISSWRWAASASTSVASSLARVIATTRGPGSSSGGAGRWVFFIPGFRRAPLEVASLHLPVETGHHQRVGAHAVPAIAGPDDERLQRRGVAQTLDLVGQRLADLLPGLATVGGDLQVVAGGAGDATVGEL